MKWYYDRVKKERVFPLGWSGKTFRRWWHFVHYSKIEKEPHISREEHSRQKEQQEQWPWRKKEPVTFQNLSEDCWSCSTGTKRGSGTRKGWSPLTYARTPCYIGLLNFKGSHGMGFWVRKPLFKPLPYRFWTAYSWASPKASLNSSFLAWRWPRHLHYQTGWLWATHEIL